MKICKKCGKEFSNRATIEGVEKNLQNRKYCLACSPWGKHNTKLLEIRDGYKRCVKCNQEKPISEFCKKTGHYFHSYCKPCLYATQIERWKARKREFVALKGGKCSRCGYSKNYSALHFHHIDPSIKEIEGSKMRLMSEEKVKKELDKCDILCSNCHAELHNPECKM